MATARKSENPAKLKKQLDDTRRATSHLLKDLDEERTALIIAEAKLMVLDKAKDEFIFLASHQLSSPITAILWGMQTLMGESIGKLNPEQKDMMATIIERSKNMSDLIEGFLDATRIESSGFDLDKGEADLLKICDSIIDEQAKQIADKKIVVKKKYGQDIPHLMIGEKTVRIILQNLLTNAIKYSKPKGTVEIKLEKTAQTVSIIVKDNGYGIPEESKSRIFTKLFRADNVKEKVPLGTGLGLYLSKSLVDKLGGKAWFESKEGKGSTFFVDLKLS
ncbi:MAG: HAMP domain-containing sensor histidine kinase [Candidatus Buchananbacteria bacterium]|jgi:signal transduction histidine kinase